VALLMLQQATMLLSLPDLHVEKHVQHYTDVGMSRLTHSGRLLGVEEQQLCGVKLRCERQQPTSKGQG
jgi:hypothetical protein